MMIDKDFDLTSHGVQQSLELAQFLQDKSIDAVFSSPYTRYGFSSPRVSSVRLLTSPLARRKAVAKLQTLSLVFSEKSTSAWMQA